MKNNIKVSIVVPCYNSEKWIEQCITSALNQDYENIEVIFVDNESTDSSVEIIKKIKSDKLILSSAPNIYPHCWDEGREEGIRLSTGDYVLIMGSDDYLEDNFISNCMNVIMKKPDKIRVLQSPIRGIRNGLGIDYISYFYKNISELKKNLVQRCVVNTPAVLYKKDVLLETKTKPKLYGGAADYDFYCQLADKGEFIFPMNHWLGFNYRWHPEQATWKVQKEGKNYDQSIQKFWREKWNL